MNKKLQELLNQINQKKLEIKNFVDQDMIDEAEKAKEELQAMQKKFDILKDVVDPEGDGTAKPIDQARAVVPAAGQKDAVHEFAEMVRSLRYMNYNKEGVNEDGGYTVPEDIQTRVEKWKEAKFSLERLVSVERVTTLSGRRTYQRRSAHTGFSKVAEAGKIGAVAGPKFEIREYTVEKYAGYLPVTNELLEDSDANITDVLVEWLGEEDIATKNALILGQIELKTKTAMTGLDDIKAALNVTLGQAFAATSAIVTNDDGFNWLDTLKKSDDSNEYLLKPAQDQTSPIKYFVAIGGRVVPVVVVPNGVFASEVTGEGANAVTKAPFIIGDLKEYVKLFDRKRLTLLSSNVASAGSGANTVNAFEQDLTLIRGIERLDAVVLDEDSIVYGQIALG